MKKTIFSMVLVMVLAGFTSCDDDDDNTTPDVKVVVTETEFTATAGHDTIQVPFTVSPAETPVTKEDLELGATALHSSEVSTLANAFVDFRILDVTKGSVAGEWIATIKGGITGIVTLVLTLDKMYRSNGFNLTVMPETIKPDKSYRAKDAIEWKRSDKDFVNGAEKTVDLTSVLEETGSIEGLKFTSLFTDINKRPVVPAFSTASITGHECKVTLVDKDNAKAGMWRFGFTREDGSTFEIRVGVLIGD